MTFYESALQEFEQEGFQDFLCIGSETFSIIWGSSKQRKIISHAKKFIEKMKINDFDIESYHVVLFQRNLQPSEWTHRQIRLYFLEWCIENNLDI
jgi:hypothetical protein